MTIRKFGSRDSGVLKLHTRAPRPLICIIIFILNSTFLIEGFFFEQKQTNSQQSNINYNDVDEKKNNKNNLWFWVLVNLNAIQLFLSNGKNH